MAETIGSLVDKLCIAELKIFHMLEQVERPDAPAEHRAQCQERAVILKQQRDDLSEELSELYTQWSKGRWTPNVYRQFKMYNDPKYKLKPPALHAR